MYPHAASSALAAAISILGLLAAVAWLVWRFGPTLMRLVGWCSWWVAWACGSQGGYGYCAALLLVGTLAWGAGTLWYARRRGRWPSPLSARLFARLPRRELSSSLAPSPHARDTRPETRASMLDLAVQANCKGFPAALRRCAPLAAHSCTVVSIGPGSATPALAP
jgi:hypothetical protein